MDDKEFLDELSNATKIAEEYSKGLLSVDDFLARYNNFYHRFALTDDENTYLSPDLTTRCKKDIEFHRVVQMDGINRLYFSVPVPMGRISPVELKELIADAVGAFRPG